MLKRVLIVTVILLLSACGRPQHDAHTLIVARPGDSTNLDPAAFAHTGDLMIIAETYERLLRRDKGGEYRGELAASWDVSDDGLRYTFDLHRDHYFDDGVNVDAAAVKYSFERIIARNRAAAHYLRWIDEIVVTDSHTLQLQTGVPFAAALATLAYTSSVIMNPNATAHLDSGAEVDQWLSEFSAGSGPYRVKYWSRGEILVLEPNRYYNEDQPFFSRVIVKSVSDPSARRIQLQKGDVDIGLHIASTNAHYYEDKQDVRLFKYPVLNTPAFWAVNTARAPLNNPLLREAINRGIDRTALIDSVLNGNADHVDSILPSGVPGYMPGLLDNHYDPAESRRLLAEAGFENGLDLRLIVGTPGPVSETLQSFLSTVGIRIELVPVAPAAFFDPIQSGDFDLAYSSDYMDFPDPWAILTPYYHSRNVGNTNYAHYRNAEVDRLLDIADASGSEADRIRAYQAAQRIIAHDAPYIFLFSANLVFATRADIEGVDIDPGISYRLGLSKLYRADTTEAEDTEVKEGP